VSDTHSEKQLLIAHRQRQGLNIFRNFENLSATFCLALFLVSGFAHADDNVLIREANAAFAQKDYSGAFSKYSVLAQHGNAIAQFSLGSFYFNGLGVQKDEKQAYDWFAKSAAQGYVHALQVLQSAAAKGNENAKVALNKLQQQTASPQTQAHGSSQQASPVPMDDKTLWAEANAAVVQKDYSGAFSKFSVLAQHGNATAQFNMGAFYFNGQGVQRDEKQAYEWFAKSAAQGHARALQVLQSAAAQGNVSAENELNKIQQQTATLQTQPPALPQQAPPVSQTPPVPTDDKTLWAEANTALVQKDYNGAFSKFSVLAQHGNAIAQFNVGAFYFNGQGVQKDEQQAYDWFAKSAAQGNARALQVMQSAAAKRDEAAKNTREASAQSTTTAASLSEPDVKVKAAAPSSQPVFRNISNTNATTAESHAGSEWSNKSSLSDFSLGIGLGQTGKMDGVKNSSSLNLLAGYKFNPNYGVELAYNSLYRNANADSLLSAAYPGTTGTFDLTSISLVGQYTYGLSDNLFLLGNLGVHTTSFKINSSGLGSRSGNSSGFVIGMKIQYDLSENIGVRGGFDTYTESGGITGTLTEVGLTVINKF
jgi:uncharacterized protein